MARTKDQNKAIRAATREKIHDSGTMLFAKKGFTATSVKDIAEEAGISTGLMYRHYSKKEELFSELVEYAASGLKQVNERFEGRGESLELIKGFTEEIVEDLKRDDRYSYFSMLMNQAVMENSTAVEKSGLKNESARMVENISRLIQEGQEREQMKEGDPKKLTYMYLSVIQGLSMLRVMNSEDFAAPEASMIMDCLIRK